jgi:hypothetical protein
MLIVLANGRILDIDDFDYVSDEVSLLRLSIEYN